MNILLISEDNQVKESLESYFDNYGLDIIHYLNARKALDNLEEINPAIILFNAVDYPRHWKVALRSYREMKDYHQGLFVLLINDKFHEEEAMKASWLGVNGLIILEELEMDHFKRLYQILSRTIHLPQRKKPLPKGGQLVFLSPQDKRLCSGLLEYNSPDCARFKSRDISSLLNLQKGDLIKDASLKRNDRVVSLHFKVLGNKGSLVLQEITQQEAETPEGVAVLS
ncbi:MAG: hypothetical protein PF447_06305 [Spirochaetaceae bacterium]|jgi:hypothetical protein|nr:hypothetical protein [Spirochaetaceae bacterium]